MATIKFLETREELENKIKELMEENNINDLEEQCDREFILNQLHEINETDLQGKELKLFLENF